jgi:hypothetical protein
MGFRIRGMGLHATAILKSQRLGVSTCTNRQTPKIQAVGCWNWHLEHLMKCSLRTWLKCSDTKRDQIRVQ